MKIRSMGALAAVPALIAGTAVAQTATTYVELDDDDPRIIEPFGLTADQLDDMDVYGPGDEQIGEIEDVLMDTSGQVVGFAVETEGFLGIGSEDVVVGLDQLELSGDRFITTLTEEQLEQLPKWDD